jgi:hypothetical protein
MWFIVALIVGAGLATAVMWMRSRGVATKWYDWVIGIVGILLLVFGLQNFIGSGAEGEADAASMWLLVTAIPAVILLAVAGQFVWRRNRAES